MRIRVRTKDIRLFIPIPDAMVGFAARFIPERAFEEMRAGYERKYQHAAGGMPGGNKGK